MEVSKDYATRKIDPRYLQRAAKIDATVVAEHLDTVALSLHQALDSWRYRNGSIKDVSMCIDALSALWCIVEMRSEDGFG